MYTEKTPLTGGQPAYSFQNPSRMYKKQVKQFQCLLCGAVLALFAIALMTAIVFSVDEDEIDAMNGNATLMGKLQATPGKPKPIKLYTSGTVVKGTVSGGIEGEAEQQVFDGTLPATLILDSIIDPDAWAASATITWSGVVSNNDTLKGSLSLPVRVNNGTAEEVKTWKGKFDITLAFKWNANLGIVIPNKVYTCKAVFAAAYKSSMSDDTENAQSAIKGATDLTTEMCTVLLQGSFYEKSFLCYLTPWWCSDKKIFYWNGGLEFKITKPPPAAPEPKPNMIKTENKPGTKTKPNNLKSVLDSATLEENMPIIGAKILGKVANGWITVQDDAGTKTIWSGAIPTNVSVSSIFFSKENSTTNLKSLDKGLTWSCSVFSNSLRGTFNIAQKNMLGLTKTVSGSFFFLLESNPSLALGNALESGVDYTSSISYRGSKEVFNGTQIINFYPHDSTVQYDPLGAKANIILLGDLDKMTKLFLWDGRFEMVVRKDPVLPNGVLKDSADGDMENSMGVPILGSSLKAGGGPPTVVGSKLIGKVASGWVAIQDETGTKTIWNGELPAPITAPMFYNPATDLTDLSDEYGHGAVWSCSVFHSSLRGSFQLPQYTKFGLVKWMKGNFFFQLESDPSWSLYDALYPGINYNSPIHFRSSDKPYNGSKLIQLISHDPEIDAMGDLGFVAPLILLGSGDKASKAFTWDGRFELIIKKDWASARKEADGANQQSVTKRPGPVLKKEKVKAAVEAAGDTTIIGSKILGKVLSGWITVTNGSGSQTVWNGQLPADIGVPMFYNPTNDMSDLTDEYGHGAVWSASVFHSTLKGTFQLPQYTKFGLTKWIKGKFFFQLASTPTWSPYDVVIPGINYYSPIHFRSVGKGFNDTKAINYYSSGPSPMDDMGFKAPIVLLGSGGKGKGSKSFSWDGRFIFIVKKLYCGGFELEVEEAFREGIERLAEEEETSRQSPKILLNTPSYRHFRLVSIAEEYGNITRLGQLSDKVTKYFLRKRPGFGSNLSEVNVAQNEEFKEYCGTPRNTCRSAKYRAIDGTCNNLEHPSDWGTAMRPFLRLLPPDYCDVVGGEMSSCCGDDKIEDCYPVLLSQDDPFFIVYNTSCMEFLRSAPAPRCVLGPREQLNQVTSFLDGSVIYGSSQGTADRLRSFERGRLAVTPSNDGRELLPTSKDLTDGCNREEETKKGRYCFLTGDSRGNENLHLTTLHLIMVRQHNKIAAKLLEVNPHWSDETTYQEAKRIVTAQVQHITYQEFLEPLLGAKIMAMYNLTVKAGHSTTYDDNVNPDIANSFATSAFRFAHSLLPGLMKSYEETSPDSLTLLRKILFNPFPLYTAGNLDRIVMSAVGTDVQQANRFFTTEITQHLFEEPQNNTAAKKCGLDLVSLNIQRGRDHGLPGYTKWREYCSLTSVSNFLDLSKEVDSDSIEAMKSLYGSVEDVDLYSGALSEMPLKGSILGPTATCLIAKQFKRIKFADRFWYDSYTGPHSFTAAQLKEIKKTTLAGIVCENADDITQVPFNLMMFSNTDNKVVECEKMAKLDYEPWKVVV